MSNIESNSVENFNQIRAQQNERVAKVGSLVLNRFFNLDTHTYAEGSLDKKTKELMGLSVSLALRCDDCVKYHIGTAIDCGATKQEITETFEIATIIGGSIVIPHLRRALTYMDEYFEYTSKSSNS